tara:strand:- start:81 stop:203 length:123 start_codon:yes stop_codon:yes gene_type:complete
VLQRFKNNTFFSIFVGGRDGKLAEGEGIKFHQREECKMAI